MKNFISWYDLTKDEQRDLRKEFSKRRKIIDLRILFYSLAFISFIPIVALIIAMVNDSCYGGACEKNIFIFCMIFVAFFLLAVINSLFLGKNQKEFISWLKNKNIEKV